MGRHTGQKAFRRDGTPRRHLQHSPIGTIGVPPTEQRRNLRVEGALVGAVMDRKTRIEIERQRIAAARMNRRRAP